MQIATKVVTQIVITEAKGKKYGFSTITVMLEDTAHHAGKISITHDGKTWNGYWGSMGSTIVPFFIGCDSTYLGGNLGAPASSEYDFKATEREAKRYLKERRRDKEIDLEAYQELLSKIPGGMRDPHHDGSLLSAVFGPDWPHCLKSKTTEQYLHFIEMVEVVQQALRQMTNTPTEQGAQAA
ncbi:hypothetical protein [Pseudomonas serbica]|uniref:hypothetical protein n=1 Tax=Pseudomonas serbica TaxID=2965074 RepID=UPI00237A8650|nr:hypothetical protein [Pseudomonas serbica]